MKKLKLSAGQGLIFRVCHIGNVEWVLNHGLHSRNSGSQYDDFRPIGNQDLIDKRQHRSVPIEPYGSLSDYVPFYFTPASPMLYNISTGWGGIEQVPNDDLIFFVSSLPRVSKIGRPFVFTDSHAYLKLANFYSDLGDLGVIDWEILQRRDFRYDPEDPGKFDRYQAEALVYDHLPLAGLIGIACHSEQTKSQIEEIARDCGQNVEIRAVQGYYF